MPIQLDGVVGRRVLVVGINYAPEVTGIGPYTAGVAEFLAASGALVRVLTGIPHYPQWRAPAAFPRRLAVRQTLGGVDVVRLWHTIPHNMTALRRAAYEASFFANAALHGLREQPSLVFGCTPALGGALAAATVANRVQCPLVLVVQDLMAKGASQSGIAGGNRVAAAVGRLEGSALRAATTVAVVGEGFTSSVAAYGVDPSRIALLRNWSRIAPSSLTLRDARYRLGWPSESFLVVHTGNMGFKQDLTNVLDAARLLLGKGVDFMIMGDGSQRGILEQRSADLNNVRILDLADPDAYPAVLAAADILLVNERPSVTEMSLPSKVTSYLASGRPILAAVPLGGATDRELQATNGAARIVCAGDPRALAHEILALRDTADERRHMGEAATSYAIKHLSQRAILGGLVNIITASDERWRSSRGSDA